MAHPAWGAQTIFTPSVHPTGEPVVFLCDEFAPAAVDGGELLWRARLLAIASILARHWPDEGARHQAALGASGPLLRASLPVGMSVLVVTSSAQLADDREWRERRKDVMTTYDKLADGVAVAGWAEARRGPAR